MVLGEAAFTDLQDLPSNADGMRKMGAKLKANYDENASKATGISSLKGSKVCAFIKCHECNKRRCVCAKTNEGYLRKRRGRQQKLKTSAKRFCCGNSFFCDIHSLSKVLSQKQSITCSTTIKKVCYNSTRRRLLLEDMCVHSSALGVSDRIF